MSNPMSPEKIDYLKRASGKNEQWEYRTYCDNPGYVENTLERLGKEGWEAFAVVGGSSCHTIYFKRRL